MTWFDTTARANFETHLLPEAGNFDHPPRCLQIGVFAGDASLWIMQNLPDATLVDVDTWQGSAEFEATGIDMKAVLAAYNARLIPFVPRLECRMQSSDEFFADYTWGRRGCEYETPDFDFVYIDGDHHAEQVLRDAVHAFDFLAPGGLLAFDDVGWEAPSKDPSDAPDVAIAAFCVVYRRHIEVVEKNSQCWVRKR